MERKNLLIIDSNSVIYRAYHALPPLTTQEGENMGAVYGFLLALFRAIKEFQPEFIAACFDVKGPTFRHEQYKEYKAKRPPTPADLISQMSKIKEVLGFFNIPIFEKQGFEADDLIGTIARLAAKNQPANEFKIIILSGDNDTLQLVDEKTRVFNLRKGVKDTLLYDENTVKEKYQGLGPKELLDYRALKGDPSDNIPGVLGIGEKTAIELIKEYGTLENIYDNLALIKGKVREKLSQHKKEAFFSRDLSEIRTDVSIDFNLENCRWADYDKEKAAAMLQRLDFQSLINRLP
ncbi:MAG: hypothetical protein HYT21_02125 [Candidatus Nealsonbacteria bacterium]|nr:hypothetical protein [Candidatus Nealsonbacteria bacterium]